PHPADLHAHGRAHEEDHEVAHGPAEPHGAHAVHGHGPWRGPHESPTAMTFPLMVLAVGAIVAGFVGVPAALWGGNAIERFLHPSFTAATIRSVRVQADRELTPAEEVRLKPDTTNEREAEVQREAEVHGAQP